MHLNDIYRPMTATPFAQNDTYMELQPCENLKPYIRCFWGSRLPCSQRKTAELSSGLIVPDTCMDIIFDINYSRNQIDSKFCGIDEQPYRLGKKLPLEELVSTFGIRFYAWSSILFSEESMGKVKNSYFDAEYHFSRLKRKLEPILFEITDLSKRAVLAEKYLLEQFCPGRENMAVMNSIAEILRHRGNVRIKELEETAHLSNRQMERLFKENTGISPKKLASLIRYQCLWKDIITNHNFNIQDEVYQLGYTDQSHLLKDFKRFHTVSLREARKLAYKDVVYLQDNDRKRIKIEAGGE